MMMMKKRNTKERMRQKWMHRSSKHKVMMGRKLKAIKTQILNKMNTLKEKMCLSRRWKRERHLRKGSLKMVEEERIKRLRR
jgi:hypothetical protein